MIRQGLTWLAVVATATTLTACGGGTPPPSSSDPPGTGERITGSERLGWNLAAVDSGELGTFRYAAYIDGGNRVELTDISCGTASGSFPCSSRMPPMTPGSHTLELVSFLLDGGSVTESPRSPAIRVNLVAATAGVDSTKAARPTNELTTSDGIELRFDIVTEQLEQPTALAFARDGRIFVAERSGRIRILSVGGLEPQPALQMDDVTLAGPSEGGVLSVTLDPQFDRTHFVYALYTTAGGDGAPRFRLARFREAGGRLGERVVLLDGPAASPARPAGSITVGPDSKLYGAFDDAGEPARARTIASYNGKVLRLNPDGTTPPDQPGGSPVYSSDLRSPRGLDWHPVTRALWIVNVVGTTEELRVIDPETAQVTEHAARAMIPLPMRTGAASLAFYRGNLMPAFRGDLLVAANEGRHLLRLRFDRRDPTRVLSTERLLQDMVSDVRVVAVGLDGAVYLCTDRALLRLSPRG
jgi:glucose/arabinose dehydrogenase